MVDHTEFKGLHAGETVWVVGSGRTLDFVDPSLFTDKVTIGVNMVLREVGGRAMYYATNHHPVARMLAEDDEFAVVVTSDVEKVPPEHQVATDIHHPRIVTVPTTEQHYSGFRPHTHWPDDGWTLPMGPSSATLALGWAEFIGASSIMLVGLDCGKVDGMGNSVAHVPHTVGPDEWERHQHYDLWEGALVSSAKVLRSRGIGVYSLNPWATLSLEGHTFGR